MKKALLFFTWLFSVSVIQAQQESLAPASSGTGDGNSQLTDRVENQVNAAATAGDYRSARSGNWNELTSWQTFNGSNWVAATQIPSNADGMISILNGHTITVNISTMVDQVVVEAGGILTIPSTLQVADGAGTDLVVNGALNLLGTLGGNGTTQVSNIMNWIEGTIGGNVTISSAGTLYLNDDMQRKLIGIFTNYGTFNWGKGIILVNNDTGATLNNYGTINATGLTGLWQYPIIPTDNVIENIGPPQFVNAGSLVRSGEDTYTSLGVRARNTGSIHVNGGTLKNFGVLILEPNTSISGHGVFQFDRNLLQINTAVSLPSTMTMNVTGGFLNRSGSLTVNGPMNWTEGDAISAVTLNIVIGPTGVLSIEGGPVGYGVSGVLTNYGLINWQRSILFSGTINNAGTIKAIGNNEALNTSGNPAQINNNGTFIKSGEGTSTKISIPFANTGTIKGAGILNFTSTFSNTGTIEPGLSPGVLTVNSGSELLSASSKLNIEINGNGGAGATNGHDQLLREGNTTLKGALKVTETGIATQGTFEIVRLTAGTLNGDFATVDLPANYTLTKGSNFVVVTKGASSVYLVAPDNKTVPTSSSLCSAPVPGIDPLVMPSGSTAAYTYLLTGATTGSGSGSASGKVFNKGVTTVTYALVSNPAQKCSFTVTVLDQEPPVSKCKPAVTLTLPEGPLILKASDIDDGSTDNCAISSRSASMDTIVYTGNYTVYLTLRDESGNFAGCMSDVTVVGLTTWYRDADGDDYGNPAISMKSSAQPAGYVPRSEDCNDADITIHPWAPELCDGKDNDCDGQADEYIIHTYYRDADGDGYGNISNPTQACLQPPTGYVTNYSDCNDNDATVHGLATFYVDADGDGYGSSVTAQLCALTALPGYSSISGDCNDAKANIHPNAPEICGNGIDENCNGLADDQCATNTYYRDADGDGYGNPNNSTTATTPPAGYVVDRTDCNDADASIHPGAPELCDNKDNNCNGSIDEGTTKLTYYRDADGDGYGNAGSTVQACSKPTGYVSTAGDCNDNDAATRPGVQEICDGKDNNCNGQTDEGCVTTQVSVSNLSVSEAVGTAYVRVSLNQAASGVVSVKYTTVNGTATATKDYRTTAGTLTFGTGQTVMTIPVIIVNDTKKEKDEYFTVQLSEALNATINGYLGRVTIVNDDGTVRHSTLIVTVVPNPSTQHFTLHIESSNNNPVDIIISDAQGRVKETIKGAPANGSIQLGQAYLPGMYYAEVIQGRERVVVQMIRL